MPTPVHERPRREVPLAPISRPAGEPRALIVPLKADGSSPAVFVVPGQYGEAFQFKRLVERLRDDIPFYSFEAKGLWGDVEPHTSIVEAAADYIAEMRAVQPVGPYYVGGFSAGGKAAWEMVHQLQEAGETAHLLLFDVGPESEGRREMKKTQRTPWRAATHPLRVFWFHARNTAGLASPRRKAYLRNLLRQEVRRFCRAVGLGREHFLFRLTLNAGRRPPPGHLAVRRANRAARQQWAWTPYDQPITLLRARIQEPGIKRGHTLGLTPELAPAGVDVRDVPGHHGFIFSEPHVFAVIAELEAWVDRMAAEDRRRALEMHPTEAPAQRQAPVAAAE